MKGIIFALALSSATQAHAEGVLAAADIEDLAADMALPTPWFATHNPYVGMPGPICTYQVVPFPAEQFCACSPWRHHAIIAHFGVEPYAKAAGFVDVAEFLQGLIADAASCDDFCTSCPNKSCAATQYWKGWR